MRIRRSGVLLVGVAALAGTALPAAAQLPPPRTSVAASVARTTVWGDESRLGGGTSLGVGLRVRPWRRWGLELDLRRLTHERRFAASGVVFDGDAVELVGSVAYHFRPAVADPFVGVGVGVIRSDQQSRFPIFDFDRPADAGPDGLPPIVGVERFRVRATHVGLHVSGGVEIPLSRRWSVRPEVRVLLGAGSVVTHIDAGASVAYGW